MRKEISPRKNDSGNDDKQKIKDSTKDDEKRAKSKRKNSDPESGMESENEEDNEEEEEEEEDCGNKEEFNKVSRTSISSAVFQIVNSSIRMSFPRVLTRIK